MTLKDQAIRVLLVEDNPGDARLVREMLAEAGAAGYELEWAESMRTSLEILASRTMDVALMDLSLPDSQADQTLASLKEMAEKIPIIVITGLADEEAAGRAVREGAQDYLGKGRFDSALLARAIRYAIGRWHLGKELRSREVEMRELNRDLSAFAHTLSHDLKVPLANAYGYAQTLRSLCHDALDQESREWCDIVIEALVRMNDIIDGMLNYSRMDGKVMASRDVELQPLVEAILSELEAAGMLHDYDVRVSKGLPAVRGDPTRIRHVLANLLSNAARYMGDNPAPLIEVGCREIDGDQVAYVRDNGMGIDSADHRRIFEPLERTNATAGMSGHGLGLAICRRAVESWGGRIWVESEPGRGSTFYFTLPGESEKATLDGD